MSAYRILAMDDEKSYRGLVQHALEMQKYEVETAINGLDALEKIKKAEKPFDLYLIDLRMPEMDGLEFLKQVEHDKTPKILCTGFIDRKLEKELYPPRELQEDMDYVIKKLGLTEEEFQDMLSIPKRNFRDYPSNYGLKIFISKYIKLLKRLLCGRSKETEPQVDCAQSVNSEDEREKVLVCSGQDTS